MALGGIRLVNRPQFEAELVRFGTQEVPARLQKVVRVASATALRGLVRKTPVGNPARWAASSLPPPPGYRPGHARGGWQVRINSTSEADNDRIDPSGNETIAAGLATISRAGPFDEVFIFSNVPYIRRLEEGYSGQAPSGMIAVTIAQLRTLKFD